MKQQPDQPRTMTINGKTCVRVKDLADAWHTTTAAILATDKRNAMPCHYLHKIKGANWCELDGLAARAKKTGNGSWIARKLCEYVESVREAKPAEATPAEATPAEATPAEATPAEAKPAEATPAEAKINIALLKKHEDTIALGIVALDKTLTDNKKKIHSIRNRARNNAHRLTKQAARLAALEKTASSLEAKAQGLENDSYRRFDTVMTRVHHVEQHVGNTAVKMVDVKRDVRFLKWAAASFAVLRVAAGVFHLVRRHR